MTDAVIIAVVAAVPPTVIGLLAYLQARAVAAKVNGVLAEQLRLAVIAERARLAAALVDAVPPEVLPKVLPVVLPGRPV